jgi:uncharacterized protein (TIRG00374 family)
MKKNIITNIIKFSLAIGLLYWLIQSGKLDFTLLKELMLTPFVMIFAIFLLLVNHALVTYRLRFIILKKATQGLSFIKLFMANWIGIFFNSVLPGSVTGDLVKVFYIQDLDRKLTKKFLIISVFLDRVIGLIGLVVVGGFVSIINYKQLISLSSDVKIVTQINIFLLLAVFVGLIFLYFFSNLPLKLLEIFTRFKALNNIVLKVQNLWLELCQFKNRLMLLILLSMIIQSMAIMIFWYLTHSFSEGELTLMKTFSVMPIGFMSIAIPIAPAGLGVGHVVFEKLLGYFSISNGASLFNIYFFALLISNLTGVIPYLFYSGKNNRKVHMEDINEINDQV